MPRSGNWSSFYPQIRPERAISDATATIHAAVEQLDLATVIKVSEAVSGEIVLDRLIDTIMRHSYSSMQAPREVYLFLLGEMIIASKRKLQPAAIR